MATAAEKITASREDFAAIFQSGAALIVENREFLNKINLFPSE